MVYGEYYRPNETKFWLEELSLIDHQETKPLKQPFPMKSDPPAEEPTVWIAFWMLLSIIIILTIALSAIIIFWVSFRLKVLGLSMKDDEFDV
jgi:hypothetical protein